MQPIEQELVLRAQNGDDAAIAALITGMMPLIRKGAAACAAPGLDLDDAVQEGLIGLFKAIRRYDPAQTPAFVAFAASCIAHAQQDARRRALRKKHEPLNFSVPLPEDSALPGPEELTIAGEGYADVVQRLNTLLTPLERQAMLAHLGGSSPAQAAQAMGRTPKTVQNALARARRKLRAALQGPTPGSGRKP